MTGRRRMLATLAAAMALALALPCAALPAGAAAPAQGSASPEAPIADVVAGPGGHVRVTEIGNPPLGTAGARARALARENARGRARGRLIKAILALPLRDGRKVEQVLRERPELKPALRAIISDATTSGVELANDSVELTITVKMDGEKGLARFLDSLQAPPARTP